MSPGLIVTLIIVGIAIMVGAALIAQSLENARKERLRQIALISERIRHLNGILNDIPSNYMTADLRTFIFGLLRQSGDAILLIDANHSPTRNLLRQLEEQSKQPFSSELDTLKAPFDDPITAQNIRSQIKELVNLIVAMNKEGSLDQSTSVKQINQGKMMYELISVDIDLLSARHSERDTSNPRVSIAHYNKCLKRIKQINLQGVIGQRVAHIESKLTQLNEKYQIQQREEAEKRAAAEAAEKAASPADDDDWKMKQDYE